MNLSGFIDQFKEVKPKGRTSKPQPATLSMFEWALTVEQEREEKPVGAGR